MADGRSRKHQPWTPNSMIPSSLMERTSATSVAGLVKVTLGDCGVLRRPDPPTPLEPTAARTDGGLCGLSTPAARWPLSGLATDSHTH